MNPEPSRHLVSDLECLVDLSGDQRDSLLASLKSIDIKLYPYDAISLKVSEVIEDDAALQQKIADVIIGLLIYYANSTLTAEAVANSIRKRVAKAKSLDDVQANSLGNFLFELLSIDVLYLSVKGSSLFEDHDQLILSSKVITDIRPIFRNDAANQMLGTILVHHLKVVYQDSKQDIGNIYFALGKNELNELITCLKRAQEKAVAISSSLDTNSIPIITESEESNV